MADVTSGPDRLAGAFDAARDRLEELRGVLDVGEPAAPTSRPKGRGSVDLRDPVDLLLVVLWTSMIGLLTAAAIAAG